MPKGSLLFHSFQTLTLMNTAAAELNYILFFTL